MTSLSRYLVGVKAASQAFRAFPFWNSFTNVFIDLFFLDEILHSTGHICYTYQRSPETIKPWVLQVFVRSCIYWWNNDFPPCSHHHSPSQIHCLSLELGRFPFTLTATHFASASLLLRASSSTHWPKEHTAKPERNLACTSADKHLIMAGRKLVRMPGSGSFSDWNNCLREEDKTHTHTQLKLQS